MEKDTELSIDIETANSKAWLDIYCKRILSDKRVLAYIMRECLDEYKGMNIDDIAEHYIEGTPQVSRIPVMPGATNSRIRGSNTEDGIPGEGVVYFDIKFIAIVPSSGEQIGLIINVEAQNKSFTDEYIMKRGVFYGARLVSSQHGTEFQGDDYKGLKKVYSIWVFFNPRSERRNTITKFKLSKEDLVGTVKMDERAYDLINIIHINLGTEKEENYSGILEMLGTLFSGRISPKDKRDKLENKFGFRMTQKLEEEMTHMCNYSDYIWEKGREDGHEDGRKEGRKEGRQEGRKEGRKSMLLDNIINVTESICADTPDTIKANVMKAMSILKVPENEREDCMLQLKERGFLE